MLGRFFCYMGWHDSVLIRRWTWRSEWRCQRCGIRDIREENW